MTNAEAHPPAEVAIGLDVGTTPVKVGGSISAWDRPGAGRTAIRECPLPPAPGWQVQGPDTILAAAGNALAKCVNSATGAKVVGGSVSSAD